MTRQLGKNQLRLLSILGCPNTILIVPTKEVRALMKRGLTHPLGSDGDSFFGVTPDGLRVLAEALEQGRIEQKLPKREPTP